MTSSWSPDAYGGGSEARAAPTARPPYRPPIGIPVPRQRRWVSTIVSVALHALVILILLAPVLGPRVLREIEGAGGEGPAGGGGGGTMGTGGGRLGPSIVERLHYVPVAPAPPAPAAAQPVTPPPPKPTPIPTPVTPPVTPPTAQPATPEAAAPAQASASAASAPVAGSGGGTGADGTAGSGPGTGGGVGSGVGTGRGAGVGPGTGGGNATVYPPVATELPLPPLPVPSRIQGTEVLVVFDVDSTGRVLRFDFEPTRDGGYNRKLRDVLGSVRFRAATRPDGQPIRAQASIRIML